MPDRYVLPLSTALASNTGGPFTARWARAVVPATGSIRSAYAVAESLASNARQNTVDIYYQTDAPSGGSNTATTILVTPITLTNIYTKGTGTIREAGVRVTAGDSLELRTDSATTGANPSFKGLTASVEIERD